MLLRTHVVLLWLGLLNVNRGENVNENDIDSQQEETANKPPSVKLLYGESNGIFRTDLESQSRLEPLLKRRDLNVFGLDYHYQRRTLYFSSWGNIWSMKLTEDMEAVGEPSVLVEDAPGATSVAVDWEEDRIYWTSPEERSVWRADLTSGNKAEVLKHAETMYKVNNVVLDPYQGLLFLAQDGGGFLRASLDGSDQWRADLRSEEYISEVPVLGVYDGSNVLEFDLTSKWWDDFVSIGVFRDQVFWAVHQESDRDTVYKANTSSNGSLTYEPEYKTDPEEINTRIWALRVYHPELQVQSQSIFTMMYESKSQGSLLRLSPIILYTSIISLIIVYYM